MKIAAGVAALSLAGNIAQYVQVRLVKADLKEADAAIAVFLAQIAVESAEMNRLEENLNYSAERLRAVWPRRFPTAEIAQRYARNPEALANFVYSNRMGNGPPESGDGWKYRGRGLKMVTGRNNYLAAATALGLPLISDPDLLLTKPAAAKSAAHFWAAHPQDLSIIADDLPDDDDEADFATITQAINGGQTGAAQRRMYWLRARKAMGLPT
jgi:putative chitinase